MFTLYIWGSQALKPGEKRSNNMGEFVLDFQDIDRSKLMLAGGKGANLGELSRIRDIQVPGGFCITTEAHRNVTKNNQALNSLLHGLTMLGPVEMGKIGEICCSIRKIIEGIPIPENIVAEVDRHLGSYPEASAFAVRSSATAEDLPEASFAGQHDTYLNIIGRQAILQHISKCWASLFTLRAVAYRLQNGFGHHCHLCVVIQRMIFPDVSGIMFTADPVTANRKILSIDASFGLGEALVSGLVTPDVYKVSNGKIIDMRAAVKKVAIYSSAGGGTIKQELCHERQTMPSLTDVQVLELEQIGRKIEAHFGYPQDIEWCLADDTFYIVQARPITTLFPIPESNDQVNRVYISVGHGQMMTDPIKPLGLSFFLLNTRAPMRKAGGRLFVDVTSHLSSPAGRQALIDTAGKSDPLIKDALMTIMDREDFIKSPPGEIKGYSTGKSVSSSAAQSQIENDPAFVAHLISSNQSSIKELAKNIQTKSGTDLFDFIVEDIPQLQKTLFDQQSLAVIMAAINASSWINEKMQEWLGEKNAADILAQSVPNNVTSEMGLALLDVADVIRPYPEVVDYLQDAKDEHFLEELLEVEGGSAARVAIMGYLDRFGMRCAGEIDITRTRWSEKPNILLPMLLNNVRNFQPGAGKRKFEQGLQEALKKEHELLYQLRQLPDGEQKAGEAKQKIDLIRNFMGYREYPKYGMVSRYAVYKQALLKEAENLVQGRVIHAKEDIYYLTFEELREVVRTHKLDYKVINQRKDEYRLFGRLTPPRVITSDGEIVTGRYKREYLPTGAMPGLAVSSGVAEGRARVIFNIEEANLEDGDILVTSFTDPSWTPLFVSIKGLVTEVGGLMTHGAVIAREYGLPAVVGVEHATTLIKDGDRIRVNGTDGYVQII